MASTADAGGSTTGPGAVKDAVNTSDPTAAADNASNTTSESEHPSHSRHNPPLPTFVDQVPSWRDYDKIIYIKVGTGENAQTFEMYKGVLKFYSGYFRIAIANIENGRFAEAAIGVITLPDEDPKIFALFRTWVFIRDFSKLTDKRLRSTTLCKIWCFADRREIPLLQNGALTALHRHFVEMNRVPAYQANLIYENTCEGSKLRQFFIHSIATRFDHTPSWLIDQFNEYWSQESLIDLVKAFAPRPHSMDADRFGEIDICQWHIHDDGVKCPKETNPPKMLAKSSLDQRPTEWEV